MWELPPPRPPSSWDLPQSRPQFEQHPPRYGYSSPASDPTRLIKMDPPIFDGSDVQSWVTRVQYFFEHIRLPEEQRLHYVVMLFAPPTTDWIFSYRANNLLVSWTQFVEEVRRRFNPNYFVNYIELIAKLQQTGTVAEYNREFERMLGQIQGVSECTLLPIYISGLRNSVKTQVRFQHPASIAAAMAFEMEFESQSRRPSQFRDSRSSPGAQSGTGLHPVQQAHHRCPNRPYLALNRGIMKLPVVRLMAAERAEKSRLGLCWYCSEK